MMLLLFLVGQVFPPSNLRVTVDVAEYISQGITGIPDGWRCHEETITISTPDVGYSQELAFCHPSN